MKFEIPDRMPLLRPVQSPSKGSFREALHSVVRRIAEKNHLALASVVNYIFNSASVGSNSSIRLGNNMMHLISKGEGISRQWVQALNSIVDTPDLWQHTLLQIISIQNVGVITCSHWRKWCSKCFEDDATSEIGPYDRLLWSIESVEVCPIHNTVLRSSCPSCGHSKLPILCGNDVSGFCPNCHAWLGGIDIPLPKGDDEYGQYLFWTARSFEDLLDADKLPIDSFDKILEMFRLLRDLHCKGTDEKFAMAIGRNKSVVCTWFKKKARPSWKALCEISYVFYVPLLDLLRADLDAVALSMVRSLPLQAARIKRKIPKKIDIQEIQAFYSAVRDDVIPRIQTLAALGRRLGIPPKELHRLFPDETKDLVLYFKMRRLQAQVKARNLRLKTLTAEVDIGVRKMILAGDKLTRRGVDRMLRLAGISVHRREASIVRKLVIETVKLLTIENETNRFESKTFQ